MCMAGAPVWLSQLCRRSNQPNTLGAMRQVPASALMPTAIGRLTPTATVLDIGCGIRPQNFIACHTSICCEPYGEYVDRLRANPALVVIQATWQQAVDLFPADSIDTVVLADVLEHLDKTEGADLLAKTIEIARYQVAVFTPLGFMEQEHPDGRDAWGMGGGEWQTHRSGWLPEDFAGWDTVSSDDFHGSHGAFWAIHHKARAPRSVGLAVAQKRLQLGWRLNRHK